MSTLQNSQTWPVTTNQQNSKYEKCLNITEEIYKRINITFQIKKNESGSQSDGSNSSLIDSNELSNETDLFAYDKSSSITSSVSDLTEKTNDNFINLNNNEEAKFKKTVPFLTVQRPKKKFRKRIKKRQATKSSHTDTDCSSDEGLPLSRIVDYGKPEEGEKPGVSTAEVKEPEEIVTFPEKDESLTKLEQQVENLKPHPIAVDLTSRVPIVQMEPLDFTVKPFQAPVEEPERSKDARCPVCNAVFRGNRGLKRHMTMMRHKEAPQ